MKRILLALLISVSCLSLFALGKKKNTLPVEGVIMMYGNMPFAFPGLVTDSGEEYTLTTENKKLMKKIRENAGNRVYVYGSVLNSSEENGKVFQMLKDGFLEVKDLEKVKRKRIKK